MTDFCSKPITLPSRSESDVKKMFNENILSALQDAMSIKTDDMSPEDFRALVLFILNFKCNLI